MVAFPWVISPEGFFLFSWVETDTQHRFPTATIQSAVRSAHLSIRGSAPRTKSRTSAQASVSSWQNRASCVQGSVLKWPIKGFLDITSPCKAIFWWLNYNWIGNIWSEFPLGFAKHILDFLFSRIFERSFWVFVELNMASFFPVLFLCSGNLGRGQRFLSLPTPLWS